MIVKACFNQHVEGSVYMVEITFDIQDGKMYNAKLIKVYTGNLMIEYDSTVDVVNFHDKFRATTAEIRRFKLAAKEALKQFYYDTQISY